MNFEEEDDLVHPEKLPIYNKGKEILDVGRKITTLIPGNEKTITAIRYCYLIS